MIAATQPFPPLEIAAKIAVSLGIGLLVGLEREWAHKDLGVRTFGISALLGMLSSLASVSFALVCLVGVLIVIAYVNWRTMIAERGLEATTSIALLVTYILGVLVGRGHLFTPVASAVVLTALLAWKAELRRFAGGLKIEEIRSAVLLALLAFVIYPILPNRFVDPWRLVNPHEAWVIVVVIAGIGFVNYVLLKVYGTRGLYVSGFLAGLVNSTAAAAELATPAAGEGTSTDVGVAALLLAIVAMFARNLLILALFAPSAALAAAIPLVAMTVGALVFARGASRHAGPTRGEIHLKSPITLRYVFSFAVLFLVIQIISTLGERYFGSSGFLAISFVGGLASSASTTAAAARMVEHTQVGAGLAGTGAVLASFASATVNLPIIHRQAKNLALTRRMAFCTVALIVIGIGALLTTQQFGFFKHPF